MQMRIKSDTFFTLNIHAFLYIIKLQREVNALQTGLKIAELRAQANITQEELAARLFVSRELVSKWETGKSKPDYKMLVKAADVFSVSIDELLDKDRILEEELSACIPSGVEIDSQRLKAEINTFLKNLSVRDRAVFLRRYMFFEETCEIADEYGLSEAYVRTLLMRTRKKLKKYLKGVKP